MKQISFLRACFMACLLIISFSARAQTWSFAEPTNGTGSGTETGKGLCTDASGNVYIAGVFNNTTDFDLSVGGNNSFTASGNDGFIVSYDKTGAFRWKTIISGTGSDFSNFQTAVCTNGTSVWVAASVNMSGSPQIISPTNTVTIVSGNTNSEALVAKLNCGDGGVNWATAFGSNTGLDAAEGIAVDPNGYCYAIGCYSGSFTLNGVTAPAVGGTSTDLFVAKFSPSGTLVHFASGGCSSVDMQLNSGGLCYVPGATPALVATGSFNYGTGTATYGSFTVTNSGSAPNNDMLLLELDTMLNFTNAIGMGSGTINLSDEIMSAVYDPYSGGVFVAGFFNNGTITVPGVGNLTSAGGEDIFIGRYSVSGNNFTWAKSAGGTTNDRSFAIAADGVGGILITGFSTSSTCSFGGSVSVTASGGFDDIIVARYNTNGTPMWATTAAGSAGDDGRGIGCYVQSSPYSQNVFVTGNFNSNATFGSTTLSSPAGNDFFLAKINDLSLPLTATQSQVNLTCNGVCTGSATVVASGGTAPYTYSWSPSGGSGATASSLCATNYTVTITDAASTSITKTFSITQPPPIVVTPVSQTNIACNGGATGAAQVNSSGGTGTLTYNWTPGSPTGDGTGSVSGLTAQVYTVTVTDANSCTATRTFNITQPPALVVTPVSQTNVACFGGATGAASVTVSGGTAGYTYDWAPGNPSGDGTASVTGLTAQVYTVTVTDANSCTATRTFNVTQPSSAVSGSTVVTNVACFGGNTGAINLTPSGGSPGYTFNWLPSGPTTEDRTSLVAGTYSVQITDANGCTGTVTATVTQPTSPVSGTTVVTNVACFGGNTGAINLTPTGGVGPYTFNWLPSGPTTEDRTSLVAGTYSVQITDANGCTGTVTATVTQPTSPVSGTTVVTNIACFGGNTGAINLTPTGGVGPYTFNWLPSGPTTEDRTSLVAGTYSVQITDANGCTGIVTASVTQPTSPVSGTTVVTNVACFGGNTGAINLTPSGGNGPYTFNWLPSGPTTEDRTNLVAGTYSVQITDVNGCTGTVVASVTQPTSPVSGTTVVTNVSCFGGSNGAINLTPSGGTGPYTFNWLPSGLTTEDRTGLTAGTYSVVITDANSCTGTVTVSVTQPTSPVSGTTVVTNVACFGGNTGAINLTPSGGVGPYTFNWLPSGPTTEDRTSLVAGTYSVVITDANSCTGTVTVSVTQPTAPVSGTTVVTNIACFGGNTGAINLTPTGGVGPYTFNWLPSGPTTEDRTSLVAGTYSVVITDANSCTGTVTVSVTQPTAPVSGTTVVTNVACFGGNTGAINLTPSGGVGPYTFNWLPSGPTTEDRTNLVAGTYSVVITDANSCTGTVTVSVTQPTAPVSGTTVVTNVACFGGNTGAINLTPTGGVGPYTFNWLPSGPTTEDRTGLAAGTYSVVITDANSCTGTVTVSVTQPTAPVSGTTVVTNVSCFGGSNGAISLTPAGGTPGYTYNWLPSGPTTQNRTGLAQGTYSVQITDANGCTATVIASVTQPTAPVSGTTVVTNVSCFGGSNGAISLTPTGGTPGYTYNWLPSGPTTQNRTGLAQGAYSVQITDANGCTGTVTATVNQPTAITASIGSTTTLCSSNTGTATVSGVTGGTPGYTYDWTPGNPTGDGTTSISGLGVGTWSCLITDANGCTLTKTVNVTTPGSPTVTLISQTNILCNGGNNGAASVNATGAGVLTYDWTPGNPSGDGTNSVSSLTAGAYNVTVTDGNGCSTTLSVSITQPTPVVATATGTNISCNGDSTGTVTVAASGGTGTLSYSWSFGGTSPTETNLPADIYSCTVTDANGCTTTATVELTEPSAIVVTHTVTDVNCFGGNDGSASVSVSGGIPGYLYNWAPGGYTTAAVTGLDENMYLVDIMDQNGCSTTDTILVNAPSQLTVSSSFTNVTCNAACNGTATATVGGGTAPYSYAWSGGQTTATVSGLCPGTYTCTVSDSHNCTSTFTVLITEPPVLTVTQMQTDVSCFGNATGDAMVMVSGGLGTYTYSWTPTGGNNATASNLNAGTYTCTISDGGCTVTATFNITEPSAPLSATTMQTNISCNGGNNGEAMVMVSGGTPNYTYAWSPSGGNAATASNLTADNYSCLITDANGCTLTETFNITEPAALANTFSVTDVNCFGSCNGSVITNVSGGTAPYAYSWAPGGNTTANLTGLCAGCYTLTVIDANACILTQTVCLTEPAQLLASVTATTNPSTCGNTDGAIDITVTGGVPTYSFLWNNSSTNEDLTGVGAGSYSVTITDGSGCTVTTGASLNDPNAPVVTVSLTFDTACSNMPGPITLMGESPVGGTWSGTGVSGNQFDPFSNSVAPGMYTVTYTYTDVNGCTGSANDTVWAELCTGINEVAAANNWQLFPNPTNGQFTLNGEVESGSFSVEIFAVDGRLVYASQKEVSATVQTTTIDLGTEATGIYFVKIRNNDHLTTMKVIRQ